MRPSLSTMARFKITPALWDRIHYYSGFPQTGVSLQQMVLFGANPSPGTLLKASQFLMEELPIRLSHRVKELDELPEGLSEMEGIKRVKEWYAESFEEIINFPPPILPPEVRSALRLSPSSSSSSPSTFSSSADYDYSTSSSSSSSSTSSTKPDGKSNPKPRADGSSGSGFPQATPNPSLDPLMHEGFDEPLPLHASMYRERQPLMSMPAGSSGANWGGTREGGGGSGNGGVAAEKMRVPLERSRYFSSPSPNITYPPSVHEYNDAFTALLEGIKRRHDPTVTTVAQGVLEWKRERRTPRIGQTIQSFLDRFYMTRIGIRFLMGQHIALNTLQPHPDYVGIICTKTNVHDVCQEAIENARYVCEEHYALFKGPPIHLVCRKDLTFPYVPGHLSHICFELLKNSLRAVVERHGVDDEDNFPPIKVVVVEGKEDLTIKISDEGGGIPRSAMPQIWTYMYTTMAESPDLDTTQNDFKAPMAGFGYGLPLSRLYARFFGGDLRLISMEGYGTDAYIHLNKLSSSREPLQ